MKIIKTSEALPKSGRYVLAWLEGAKIPMRAMWAAQHTLPLGDDADPEWGEYSEEKDEYFCPAGWYEMNQHEEQHWSVDGNVVAWCELPRLDHQCLAQIAEPAGAAPAAVAPLPAVFEQIAQSWDGCMYDAPGETLDIGADIRAAAKRLLTEQPAAMAGHAQATPALEAPAFDLHKAAAQALADLERAAGNIASAVALRAALEAPAAPVGSARQFIEWMYSQPEDREPTTAEGALLEFEAHLAAAAPQAPAAPVHSKTYSDGTVATGSGELPAQSPQQQVLCTLLDTVEAMLDGANGPTIQIRAALLAAPAAPAVDALAPVQALLDVHAELLDANPYAYFELAYTRQTGWMAWITDKPMYGAQLINPDRKVLARGQGDTAAAACAAAAQAKEGGEA